MKAISHFKYLFQRKSVYYFRFKLVYHFPQPEIVFSLKTKVLADAVFLWQKLIPYTEKLKQLVLLGDKVTQSRCTLLYQGIKSDMLKQLHINQTDALIADMEKDYSSVAHMMKASVDNDGINFSDNDRERLLYLLGDGSEESFDIRLGKVLKNLSSDEKNSFTEALAAVGGIFNKFELNTSDEFDDESFVEQAKELLQSKGFVVDENSMPFKVLVNKIQASQKIQNEIVTAVLNNEAVKERELSKLITQPVVEVSVKAMPGSTAPLFSQVYSEFLELKIKKDKLSEKMKKSYNRIHKVWLAIAEDKPIDCYTPKDIGQFIDRCFELPKMNILPYSKMTWEQRLSADVPEEDLQAPKSVEQYYKWVMGVFAYAKRDTVDYITTSPCTIKRNFKANIRGVFSEQELKLLLKAANSEDQVWKKWIIYLGIYTGARRGELIQLRKEDVKYDVDTKRYYILITDSHESQNLKTENSKRKIPLHNELIKSGFIDYVETCKDRVFDEVTNVEVVTGWMPRQMKNLGVDTNNELGHIRSFHSFRHTFITKLMNSGVQVNLLQQVVGHEISSFGITSGYTHKSTELKSLLCVVDSFDI